MSESAEKTSFQARTVRGRFREILLLASFLLFSGGFCLDGLAQGTAGPASQPDSCLSCHSQLTGPAAAVVMRMQEDIHTQRGFSCVDCHGGDASQTDAGLAKDLRMGFVGRPEPGAVQSFCGKCHSSADFMRTYNPSIRIDQVAEYVTSVHGMKVAEGDDRVATCISCHDHHGIRAVSDTNAAVYPARVAATCGTCHANAEYMASYPIGTDQVDEYLGSVHAAALLERHDISAPTCNDCHGNHGATPPGIASVANVCGTCHTRQEELLHQSPHQAFASMGLADCLVCHSNHEIHPATDQMLGVGPDAPCSICHSDGDPGYSAAERMRTRIDQLVEAVAQAETVLDRAARAGMEVSRPRFELSDAGDSLVNARVAIHAFSPEELDQAVEPGLQVARTSYQAGLDALEQLQFRRNGLAVSLAIILLAVIAIKLKIRQLERTDQN